MAYVVVGHQKSDKNQFSYKNIPLSYSFSRFYSTNMKMECVLHKCEFFLFFGQKYSVSVILEETAIAALCTLTKNEPRLLWNTVVIRNNNEYLWHERWERYLGISALNVTFVFSSDFLLWKISIHFVRAKKRIFLFFLLFSLFLSLFGQIIPFNNAFSLFVDTGHVIKITFSVNYLIRAYKSTQWWPRGPADAVQSLNIQHDFVQALQNSTWLENLANFSK